MSDGYGGVRGAGQANRLDSRSGLQADPVIQRAMDALTVARKAFIAAANQGLILGNDNHIGDIGEYWVRQYLARRGLFRGYAPSRNSLYDLEDSDGVRYSVKTMTEWSQAGYGTPVKPLDGIHWQVLAAVYLDRRLHPARIALVPIERLCAKEPFTANSAKRATGAIKSYPRFQWWSWLEDFVVYDPRGTSSGAPG